MRRLALVSALLLAAPSALAHTQWMDPTPRTPCNGTSAMCKTAPCGGVAAGAPVKTFFVGSSYTLAYQETIEHPGHFRIALSTNGEASDAPFDANILADNLPDTAGTAPHDYTWTWVVPDTANCNPCVLQVEQFMSATSTYYYSCADVRILPAGAATPTPAESATPTATPGDPADPNDVIHGSCACDVSREASVGSVGALTALLGAALLARRRARA